MFCLHFNKLFPCVDQSVNLFYYNTNKKDFDLENKIKCVKQHDVGATLYYFTNKK